MTRKGRRLSGSAATFAGTHRGTTGATRAAATGVLKDVVENESGSGVAVCVVDLDTAQKIEDLDGLEGLKTDIQIFKSDNFPEEYNVEGEISRKDLRKKQLGLAIRFTEA